MFEYYADVIVDELSAKLGGLYGVTVWGGSSRNRLLELLRTKGSGLLPFVGVSYEFEVAQENRRYAVIRSSGELAIKSYDDEAIPILFKPELWVYGNTRNEVKEIVDVLHSLFADGAMYKTPSDKNGEAIPIFVRTICKDVEIEARGGLSKTASPIECHTACLDLTATPRPLLTNTIDYGELKRNRYMQYRFVQIAQWCDKIALKPKALEHRLDRYRYAIDPSYKSDRYERSSRSAHKTSLDDLHEMSMNNETLPRDLLEKWAKDLIPLCPDLFDRYIAKEPYASTAKYITDKASRLDQLKHKICNYLDLPRHEDMQIEKTYQPRERGAFERYLQYMDENPSLLLQDVYSLYRRDLEEELRDVEHEQQLAYRPQMHSEESQGESESSGAALGGLILSSIIGNAIGNYGERKELRKQTALMEEADKRARKAEQDRERAERERKRRMRFEYDLYIHDMGTAAGRKKWEGRTPPPYPDYS